MSAKLTDEGLFVSCPARRRRPHIPAASAATYPLRCFAPQWARFDNRHSTSAPDPTLAPRQRQRRRRYKQSPEPTTIPAEPIPRSQHRQICTYPPRAKGSLNRRFEWFSLVPFFLQKKKGTRAGARNAPACARRRRPPYPGGISRHQPKPPSGRLWRDLIIAKNDQRTSPYPRCCQRQRRKRYKQSPEPTTSPTAPIPRSQHRQICTCLPRAKGSLNRRFEWFSLVTFFLQKKKVTRAGARNAPSRARRRKIIPVGDK